MPLYHETHISGSANTLEVISHNHADNASSATTPKDSNNEGKTRTSLIGMISSRICVLERCQRKIILGSHCAYAIHS
jgi:hypothetical protein